MINLFGEEINPNEAIHVNIYSDEIWETSHKDTGEVWIYSVAIYEMLDNPLLDDLLETRYCKNKAGWEEYKAKNDAELHWADFGDDADHEFIIQRWLDYIYDDCFGDRKFYFSLIGINLTNLNRGEFGTTQNLNSIYNRFYRSMLKYSLKKFFGSNVVVENIYHEDGPQKANAYFDWHTIFILDKEEQLYFNCKKVVFLPKSHREDPRSNILQLCDILAGIFKDLHCGVEESGRRRRKNKILESITVQELFIKRVIKNPNNKNSKFSYHKRFNLSFFPKIKSDSNSIQRLMNNFYNSDRISLACDSDPEQLSLL